MVRVSVQTIPFGPAGSERVFNDEQGRVWTAAFVRDAVVFTCVSDGRQTGRAIAVTDGDLAADIGDDRLRAWLSSAPEIGRLT